MRRFTIAILFSLSALCYGQAPDTTRVLSPVVISPVSQMDSVNSLLPSIEKIERRNIQNGDQTTFADELNRIPGMQMQQGALNTARITLRGIGARSPYSTNRVRAYLEGIPLTDGQGVTVIEDIEPDLIDGMTIIKGPASAFYGSGLGGAIALDVKEPDADRFTGNVRGMLGGFNTYKLGSTFSGQLGPVSVRTSFNSLDSDGYRQNSSYERDNVFAFAKMPLGSQKQNKTSISLLANLNQVKAFIPSSIDRETFEGNPEAAADSWLNARGYEDYTSLLMGLSLNGHLGKSRLDYGLSTFYTSFDNYEPRPFNILTENNYQIGLRGFLGFPTAILPESGFLTFTTEIVRGNFTTQLFENTAPDDGSARGDRFGLTEGKSLQGFVALTHQQPLGKYWNLETALNVSQIGYSLTDKIADAPELDKDFEVQVMPSVSLRYYLAEEHDLTASVSRGYSQPGIDDVQNRDGSFNQALDVEQGWNYEVAYTGNWFSRKLITQFNLYTIQIDNLLISERVAPDVNETTNAGSTDHHGLEISASYLLVNDAKWRVQPYLNASINQFYFDGFVEEGEDFSGNELTGVPREVVNVGLNASWNDFSFFTNYRHTSGIPLDDANSRYTAAYGLLEAQVDYRFKVAGTAFRLYAGGNNLLDVNYPAQVLPNAPSFGGAAPRFFYPGNPINGYLGAMWQF